jgi:hypothetical protein
MRGDFGLYSVDHPNLPGAPDTLLSKPSEEDEANAEAT